MNKILSLAMVMGLVAFTLHGCGCDTSAVDSCIKDVSETDACKLNQKNIACIVDNNCCDNEENGVKMKDTVNTWATLVEALADCDVSKC